MSDFLKKFREVFDLGKEFIETATYKGRLSTLFDIFTEKVIPSFVSDKDLEEYYEKKMEEVNDFIYKM